MLRVPPPLLESDQWGDHSKAESLRFFVCLRIGMVSYPVNYLQALSTEGESKGTLTLVNC
jgi:hypothetical protein